MRLKSLLAGALFFTSLSAQSSILPENDLHLQDHPAMLANMTEDEFVAIIERVEDYYAPIVASHGAKLHIEKRWNDSTVNAYAQQMGKTWKVSMFGGLARRPEVTADGFMLVVCHELGHHLGGFPFSRGWAANEGQSDFFATQACAKNIWGSDTVTNSTFRNSVHKTAKASCDAVYSDTSAQDLCYRTAMGGQSLAKLLGALSKLPPVDFDTPDTSEVARTNHAHPKAQCRLDTYINGALCTVDFDEDFIPGKKVGGWFGKARKQEIESLRYTCSQTNPDHALAQRPKCWFKQKITESDIQG